MEELLKKYYEYFIKINFQNKANSDKFYEFYKSIIAEYDITKDKQIKKDIMYFFEFFDTMDFLGTKIKGLFSMSKGEEISKRTFKRHCEGYASFEWFKASPYMVRREGFIYSIKHTKNIFCKVYMSIKPDKYVKTIIKLQEFINQLYLNHPNEELGECKFRNAPQMMQLF